ncbi:MAG: Rieske (2Fe-2S) protein [Verrucomicrobia bacterium]|nr:Rieske (2Fe-2S) protein [Verrucomicrobiota bacterium]MBV8640406.1 Rieske (2Fe-2S) protein [Verrucomicrobiota bacterium]
MKTDDQEDATPGLNRRQFLMLAAAAVASPQAVHGRGPTDAHAQRVIDVGPITNYNADGLYDAYRDLGFFVVRKGEKLIALSSFCTHRRCKLATARDRSFYCNCHGSTFDPNGKVTAGPANRDLPKLPTVTDDRGHLLVKIPTG